MSSALTFRVKDPAGNQASLAVPVSVSSGTLYADINPNTSGTLAGWQHIENGGSAFPASSYPNGQTSPAIVRVVDDPLGQQGKVYELTVTPQALANNNTANRVDLFQNSGVPWYGQGKDHWEHFRVMFPSGGAYRPTPGNFNWIYQHHNIIAGAAGTGVVMGLHTNTSPANQLFVRVAGGDTNALPSPTTQFLGKSLANDHWYDMQFYIYYSTGNDGVCQWYVDGAKIMDVTRPTLFWNAKSGVYDQPNYEYSNYRLYNSTITWNSTIYFSRHKQGSTQSIVSSL